MWIRRAVREYAHIPVVDNAVQRAGEVIHRIHGDNLSRPLSTFHPRGTPRLVHTVIHGSDFLEPLDEFIDDGIEFHVTLTLARDFVVGMQNRRMVASAE